MVNAAWRSGRACAPPAQGKTLQLLFGPHFVVSVAKSRCQNGVARRGRYRAPSRAIWDYVKCFNSLQLPVCRPALLWVVREQFRQSDAADAGETLKSDAERLFDEVTSGNCFGPECENRSREFQDAIFGRRVANPPIFPLVYRFMRPEMEKQMEAGAFALLKEYASSKI